MTSRTLYTEACERLLASALEDADLGEEWPGAQADFFGAAPPAGGLPETRAAARRCEEWFLLERPSRRYGQVPYLTCVARAQTGARAEVREFLEEMGGNLLGAFEVLDVETDGRLELVELFSGRALSVSGEATERGGIETGDLLVGRVFPVGKEDFVFSDAIARFRSPSLLEAVREDLARARAATPTARLSQRELESIFWSGRSSVEEDGAGASPAEEARALLEAANIPGLSFGEVREALSKTSRGGVVIGPILDRLAFGSAIDLENARRVLWGMWSDLRRERPVVAASEPGEAIVEVRSPTERIACRCGSGKSYAACCRSVDAVARFEKGRARGEDLQKLFDQLESDLEIDTEEGAGEAGESFDTPATLGPVFEEFFWEAEREGGSATLSRFAVLGDFSRFLLEEVDPPVRDLDGLEDRHLTEFVAGRFFPEAPVPSLGPEEAAAFRTSLREFCGWAQTEQDVPLLRRFGAFLERLDADLPRAVEANALLGPARSNRTRGTSTYRVRIGPVRGHRETVVEAADSGRAEEEGFPRSVRVDERLAPLVRDGDLLVGTLGEGDELLVERLVPPSARGAVGPRP